MRYKVFISAIAFSLLSTASYARISDADMVKDIEKCLSQGRATTVCEYPEDWRNLNEPLRVARNITWNTPATLQLISKEDIIFEQDAFIKSEGAGSLLLKAGMENKNNGDYKNAPQGKIVFKDEAVPHISINEGAVKFYYNPEKGAPGEWNEKNKYWNGLSHFYEQRVTFQGEKNIVSYMLVNHARDLQDIRKALYNSYAISQDIDAIETKMWDDGKGFRPLKEERIFPHGFSGNFDGNDHTISNLHINRPEEDHVGLFGRISGVPFSLSYISNLKLRNLKITGGHYVGGLSGSAVDSEISNIDVSDSLINGEAFVGGVIGSASRATLKETFAKQSTNVSSPEYVGTLFGAGIDMKLSYNDINTIYNFHNLTLQASCEKDGESYFCQSRFGSFLLPLQFYWQNYEITCKRYH